MTLSHRYIKRRGKKAYQIVSLGLRWAESQLLPSHTLLHLSVYPAILTLCKAVERGLKQEFGNLVFVSAKYLFDTD